MKRRATKKRRVRRQKTRRLRGGVFSYFFPPRPVTPPPLLPGAQAGNVYKVGPFNPALIAPVAPVASVHPFRKRAPSNNNSTNNSNNNTRVIIGNMPNHETVRLKQLKQLKQIWPDSPKVIETFIINLKEPNDILDILNEFDSKKNINIPDKKTYLKTILEQAIRDDLIKQIKTLLNISNSTTIVNNRVEHVYSYEGGFGSSTVEGTTTIAQLLNDVKDKNIKAIRAFVYN